MSTVLQLIDDADQDLCQARLAAQGQDPARAVAFLDSARMRLVQARSLLERPPTGEYPVLKKP